MVFKPSKSVNEFSKPSEHLILDSGLKDHKTVYNQPATPVA